MKASGPNPDSLIYLFDFFHGRSTLREVSSVSKVLYPPSLSMTAAHRAVAFRWYGRCSHVGLLLNVALSTGSKMRKSGIKLQHICIRTRQKLLMRRLLQRSPFSFFHDFLRYSGSWPVTITNVYPSYLF